MTLLFVFIATNHRKYPHSYDMKNLDILCDNDSISHEEKLLKRSKNKHINYIIFSLCVILIVDMTVHAYVRK